MNTQKKILKVITVLSLAMSPMMSYAESGIPIGDGKISTTKPQKGYLYSCEIPRGGGGAQKAGDWIKNGLWYPDKKPTVNGNIMWKNASLSLSVKDSDRIITGNSLPLKHGTGTYPVNPLDDAYIYDRNPNTISPQNITLSLPTNPKINKQPACVNMGMIGIMLSGAPLYNALDGEGRDAAAYEIQDACGGHPEMSGQYHYHNMSTCISQKNNKKQALVGYALDGFGIYTGYDEIGKKITNKDLDECHGITSSVLWNGKNISIYHYVMTDEFPYSIGCFKGTPKKPTSVNSGSVNNQKMERRGIQNQTKNTQGGETMPPAEAINACLDKIAGDSCSVGNSQEMGSCKKRSNIIACIPSK